MTSRQPFDSSDDDENPFPDLVVLEITGHLRPSHSSAREVRAIVEEYLLEAHKAGFRYLRIIHGKGIGVQREIVRGVLARTTIVTEYYDAPPDAGGLGATLVELAE
jgi:hypothetical protein